MKTITGDLIHLALSGQFDVIVHGCNCFCTMGAGIAKSIKAVFPEAYKADCDTTKGAKNKLGTISWVNLTRDHHKITLVNAYTQYHWRGQGVLADYEAIRSAFRHIKNRFSGKKIGYPMIGAGLAGGDWNRIAKFIDEELEGQDHTLVVYKP